MSAGLQPSPHSNDGRYCHLSHSQPDDDGVSGYRFCVAALLSSKFLDLNTSWQGMSPLTIAQQNGHRKIKEIILVGEERSELTDCH